MGSWRARRVEVLTAARLAGLTTRFPLWRSQGDKNKFLRLVLTRVSKVAEAGQIMIAWPKRYSAARSKLTENAEWAVQRAGAFLVAIRALLDAAE